MPNEIVILPRRPRCLTLDFDLVRPAERPDDVAFPILLDHIVRAEVMNVLSGYAPDGPAHDVPTGKHSDREAYDVLPVADDVAIHIDEDRSR